MDHEPGWVEQLWDDLAELEPADRVKVAGDWITKMTHHLLPQLAEFRRKQVVLLLGELDWDSQRLAETIGSRVGTINRLAREHRRGRT